MVNKSLYYIVLLFTINTMSFASFIEYETNNIGGNEWEYTYTIGDFSPNKNDGFTLYFEYGLFSDLSVGSGPVEWDFFTDDPYVFLGYEEYGVFDGMALSDGAPIDQTFSVSFTWLGGAEGPGAQLYEFYNDGPLGFSILESGVSIPKASSVPEPSTFSLLLFVFFSLFCLRVWKKKDALLIVVAVLLLGRGIAYAQQPALSIGNYQLVSKTRVSRTLYNYVFKADVTNNSGAAAANVIASATSSSSAIVLDDNTLSFGNLSQGGTASSSDVFSVQFDRSYSFNESDLIWNFQYDQTMIDLSAGLSTVTVPVSAKSNIAFTVNFQTTSTENFHITFNQTISPANGGIVISYDYTPGWTTNHPMSWVVNEAISGIALGTYQITTTATITETGESDQVTTLVYVTSGTDTPVLNPLGASPDAIAVSTSADVKFTTIITGTEAVPTSLVVEKVDQAGNVLEELGGLNDEGCSGDLQAGDRVFSGTYNVQSGEATGTMFFRAKGIFTGLAQPVFSDVHTIYITNFPIGMRPSDMSQVVTDPATGEQMIGNEVLVGFKEGTSSATINAIVNSIGGTIIGTILTFNLYQVQFPGTGDVQGVKDAIAALKALPEVLNAEPNDISTTPDEVTPNDPKYSSQWGPQKIRADETWVIARSTMTVAVIGTGVDYNHEDLSGIVTKGRDFGDGDDEPMDGAGTFKGHETHIAGIIAANVNNNKGIAGVTWGSKILAIKIYKDSDGSTTRAIEAEAIKAAVDSGSKIINYSSSNPSPNTGIHDAVKYAENKGVLFVAAAGNKGNSTQRYPGAYTEAFCVGATTQSDTKCSFSNYGDWVDIAAPGEGIYSTRPNNGYDNDDGTSFSTPFVAAAAAIVWSQHPSWSAVKIRERLEKTAKPLASTLKLGAGRLDLFEAVFNGSFEIGDLSEWKYTGTASSIENLGVTAIVPQDFNGHKKRMGYVSTGPAGDYVSSKLYHEFTIQPGVSSFKVLFDYNLVSEEYPEWVGTVYNDAFTIKLKTPSGTEHILATETINGASFTPVSGFDFPGGDNTIGMTGWKPVSTTVPVTEGAGTYEIFVTDAGDDVFDTVLLLDNVRFK